jgi:xanthine dehydrogenase accessory factor
MTNLTVTLPVNQPEQARNLIEQVLECLRAGDSVAMLTLVDIEGSAPYPLGSQMLVTESGARFGQITGGCAETALADQAVRAIRDNLDQTHRYGAGSPFFDIQLPCGSGIDVHIDVSTSEANYRLLRDQLRSRKSAELHLSIEKTTDLTESKQARANYVKRYQPNERLLVFGQGPILVALTKLATATGFEVIAVAQDEENVDDLARAGFKATTLVNAQDKYLGAIDEFCAVVSLFHEHERELTLFENLLNTDAFYLGALGSRRTHAERLNALVALGFEQRTVQRIVGPVGLDIGAESPTQIAISILAQVIASMPKVSRD